MHNAETTLAQHYALVRAANTGDARRRAGTELLIRTGWARPRMVWLDADGRIDASRMTDEYVGGHSGGEQRLLRVAASLLGGEPVDLSEALWGMDVEWKEQILAAIAQALDLDGYAMVVRTQGAAA
jgi:hypothetical protein